MAGPPGHEAARQALQARRAEAVRLQLTLGWLPLEIGRHLYADPAHNSRGQATPEGYGADRYRAGEPPLTDARLAQLVTRDIARTLKARQTKYDHDVDALRRLRVAQYEQLLRAALEEASGDTDPDVWEDPEDRNKAAERRFKARAQAVSILTRLDVVQGTPRPARTEVTGADGAPLIDLESVEELRKLIALNAAADQQEGPAGG
ncbi:hypothetical protein ACIF6L_34790 [Kitasatospora sp. NPDC086009]|uniref:hypothetical protein n=1 Tax=unclassified Kitasatospora TaxID=2633591 RepID=UPI0037CA9A92